MSASAQPTPSAGPTAPGTSHSRAACRPKRRQAHTCVTAHDRLPRPHACPRATMGLAPTRTWDSGRAELGPVHVARTPLALTALVTWSSAPRAPTLAPYRHFLVLCDLKTPGPRAPAPVKAW